MFPISTLVETYLLLILWKKLPTLRHTASNQIWHSLSKIFSWTTSVIPACQNNCSRSDSELLEMNIERDHPIFEVKIVLWAWSCFIIRWTIVKRFRSNRVISMIRGDQEIARVMSASCYVYILLIAVAVLKTIYLYRNYWACTGHYWICSVKTSCAQKIFGWFFEPNSVFEFESYLKHFVLYFNQIGCIKQQSVAFGDFFLDLRKTLLCFVLLFRCQARTTRRADWSW